MNRRINFFFQLKTIINMPPVPENRSKFLAVYAKYLIEKRDTDEIESFLCHPGSSSYFPALAGYSGFLVGFPFHYIISF